MNQLKKYFSIHSTINYLIILYAFILPISRGGISIITALLFLLWLFDDKLKERFRVLLDIKVILALLAFLLLTIISLSWSTNIEEGVHTLRRYWYILPVIVFATHIRAEDIFKIISAFLLGIVVSEIASYGIFFEIWTMKHGTPSDPAPFMNHLQYSMFLAFTSLLLLNRAFFAKEKLYKVGYFLYFLLTTSSLFINGGRTGQAAFLVGIFIVGFLNVKNKFVALSTMIFIAAIVFISAYQLSPVFKSKIAQTQTTINKFINNDKSQYETSFGQRVAAWTIATKLFQDNPFLGTGVGCEMDALQNKIDEEDLKIFRCAYEIKHYHNNYVTYLVQLGILGLLIYISIFIAIAVLKIKNSEINNLKYIFVAIFMTSSMFEQMFAGQFPLALFTLFVGIFIASATNNNEKQKIDP